MSRHNLKSLVLAAAILAAGLIPLATADAQRSRRSSWWTTIGELRVTPEGWVELRRSRPSAMPPHHDPLEGMLVRLAPRAARDWATTARRMLADTIAPRAQVHIPPLGDLFAEVQVVMTRDTTRMHYSIHVQSRCRLGGAISSLGEVMLLVNAVDAAARSALARRADPVALVNRAESASDVGCPVRLAPARMPAWPLAIARRGAARGEVLARFAVATTGAIDLGTLQWDHALPRAAERAARAALARWRYLPATTSTGRVAQWTHAVIWFADSTDAAERQAAGWEPTRSFAARHDGFVEHTRRDGWPDSLHRFDETPRFRELYTPEAVRAWSDRLEQSDTGGALLRAPNGITREDRLIGNGDPRRFFRYDGCPVFPFTVAGHVTLDERRALRDEALAAAEAAGTGPARLDPTRVRGEAEVSCPARLITPLTQPAAPAEGAGEIAVSFVVAPTGRVRRASITLLGTSDTAVKRRVASALVAQRWTPARLGGVRVPQRAHLILYPTRPRNRERARVACAQASHTAVQLQVRSPAAGISPPELTRIAHAFSTEVGKVAPNRTVGGAFQVRLDHDGNPHGFTWTRRPTVARGGDIIEYLFRERTGYDRVQLVRVVPGAPIALSARLLATCP